MSTFAGRTAFITGGGSGVGAGLAEAFLEAGARVVIADMHQDRLEQIGHSLGSGDVLTIAFDVADREAWVAAANKAEGRFGAVDILCNNAGVNSEIPLVDARYEDWDWMLGVNLGGAINGMQTFVPRFVSRGASAHNVNTGSILGFLPLGPATIYTTSKFAIRGLSSAARLDLAPHGIGVSCLCPGLVKSRGMESEANRPPHLFVAGRPEGPGGEAIAAVNDMGMDPLEVGRRALHGIERNDEFIFTHAEHKPEVEELCSLLVGAFPWDDDVPAHRAALEENMRAYRAAARTRAAEARPLALAD